jgi:hypothetical protein
MGFARDKNRAEQPVSITNTSAAAHDLQAFPIWFVIHYLSFNSMSKVSGMLERMLSKNGG